MSTTETQPAAEAVTEALTEAVTEAVTRTETRLDTGSGVELAATWHAPHRAPRGVAVVAPGVAVPARVMGGLADALAAAGWAALRFDFPGVGASPDRPQDVPGAMVEWATRDLDTVLAVARDRAGDDPVVLVGHSAGAWLLGLSQRSDDVDAVLAIASMSGSWRGLKRSAWPQLLPAMYLAIPLLTRLTGRLPGWSGLGADAPGAAMRQWAAWCRRPRFFLDDPTVTSHLGEIAAPVRVVLATDDQWATLASSRAVWDRTVGPTEYVMVDPEDHGGHPIGHIGLLRARFADTVWADALRWLGDVTAPVTR